MATFAGSRGTANILADQKAIDMADLFGEWAIVRTHTAAGERILAVSESMRPVARVVRHHVSASLGRKLRDEQNTARLLQRWRHRILALIPRACARACVAAAWANPGDYYRMPLAYESLLYATGVLSHPSPRIEAAAAQALDLEAARWDHLLNKGPLPVPYEIAPDWFPVKPDKAPV